MPSRRRRRAAKLCTLFALIGAGVWLASCAWGVQVAVGDRVQIELGGGALAVRHTGQPLLPYRPDPLRYPYQLGSWPLRFSHVVRWPAPRFKPTFRRMGTAWSLVLPLWVLPATAGLLAWLLWRSARVDPDRCPRCGYLLHNLAMPRCPECGLWYVERQRWVYMEKPPQQRPDTRTG